MSTPPATTETEGVRYRTGYDGRTTGRRTFTETKNGFRTTEFYVMLLFVAGVLIAAYASDDDALARDEGWLFASFAVASYIVSRGFAKLATREPYDERDR